MLNKEYLKVSINAAIASIALPNDIAITFNFTEKSLKVNINSKMNKTMARLILAKSQLINYANSIVMNIEYKLNKLSEKEKTAYYNLALLVRKAIINYLLRKADLNKIEESISLNKDNIKINITEIAIKAINVNFFEEKLDKEEEKKVEKTEEK